jgi:hypothetical protein
MVLLLSLHISVQKHATLIIGLYKSLKIDLSLVLGPRVI